jgi:DNA end-binding protein Ku
MANGKRRESLETGPEEARPRARAFWSGTLTFGLVSIPVDLYAATRRGRVGLRMLAPDGHPLRRRFYCSKEGREVPPEHLVRGFELEDGSHVVVSDEEIDALAPERSRDIDLKRFVPVAEIDPMFFDRPYVLAPSGESTKAYRLLATVMEEGGRAGIATFVMRGKEYLIAILATHGLLRAETLRFADEVRSAEDVGLEDPGRASATVVERLEKAISSLAADGLDPDELEDPWTEELRAIAERKRRKGEDVFEVGAKEAAEEGAEIIDLMAVLKRSLGQAGAGGGGGRERGGSGRRAGAAKEPAARRPGPAKRSSAAKGAGRRRARKRS